MGEVSEEPRGTRGERGNAFSFEPSWTIQPASSVRACESSLATTSCVSDFFY